MTPSWCTPWTPAMSKQVSDEICNCGHRKSQHEAIVCGWWNCRCKEFEPLTASEPKRERKPVEEFPRAADIVSADVVAQEEPLTPEEPKQEWKPVEETPHAGDIIRADVVAQEVEELRSKLSAAQEEIGRLKQLQDENHALATRLGAENNLLRDGLAEIKRLVEAMLARP